MPTRALTYRWFAKVYGWTPGQVEELDLELQDWLPTIEDAASEAHEFMVKQNTKTQGPGRR